MLSRYDKQIGEEVRCGGMLTVPYVKAVSEQFKRILKWKNVSVVLKGAPPLSYYLCIQKDPISVKLKQNVIFTLSCLIEDCSATQRGKVTVVSKKRVRDHPKAT